jgi:hypothetical protein
MTLKFFPPLAATTPLAVPPAGADGASTALELIFTATCASPAARNTLVNAGARIELWTDLPVGGRAPGEWGALAFAAPSPSAPEPKPTSEDVPTFALDGPAPPPHAADDGRALRLCCTALVPAYAGAGTHYRFTYRVAHADGRVDWLGEYGRDGVLALERADARAQLAAPARWDVRTQEEAVCAVEGTEDVEVLVLEPKLDWKIWTVDADGWGSHRSLAAHPS